MNAVASMAPVLIAYMREPTEFSEKGLDTAIEVLATDSDPLVRRAVEVHRRAQMAARFTRRLVLQRAIEALRRHEPELVRELEAVAP